MKNEKAIVYAVAKKYPELEGHEKEMLEFVKDVFAEIVTSVWNGDKVIWKNVGTFMLKNKKQRKRYDQGLKQVVETPPLKTVKFTQSPNIFRNEK